MIIRIILILVVIMTHFAVCVSAAGAFDDNWMELQQQMLKQQLDQLRQDLKLQQQLLKQKLDQQRQDLKMQQQQFRQELRQRRQDFKLQQETIKLGKFQMQQFGLPRSFNSNLYIVTNFSRLITAPTIDPIITSPRSSIPLYRELNSPVSQSFRDLRQESSTWRSLEAGGLTHIGDHISMFKRSLDLIREGLTYQKLGPDVIMAPSRQLMWKVSPIDTPSVTILRGLSTGLHFGGALIKDWDMMEKGSWRWSRSYTWDAAGSYGLSEVRKFANIYVNSLGNELKSPMIRFATKWTYGLPDTVQAFSSQLGRRSFTPNIDELTNYLDSIHTTLAGRLWGPAGATIFKAAAITGRFITYPQFESLAMRDVRKQVLNDYSILRNSWEANSLPIKSMAKVYGAENLRRMGFGSDITGLPSMSNLNTSYRATSWSYTPKMDWNSRSIDWNRKWK